MFVTSLPAIAQAQQFDLVGTRARGMGGAFVAVADDGSATWWNPAGISNSLILDGVIEWQSDQLTRPVPDATNVEAGGRARVAGAAFALPAVGVSYFHVSDARLEPVATAGAAQDREDRGTTTTGRELVSDQVGLSLAQSLGDYVVVGATVRVVRGVVSALQTAPADADAAFDALGDAEGHARVRGDVDVGVLARWSRLRVGFSARNLAAPEFASATGPDWQVERQARIGAAIVGDADRAGRHDWVVAVDADLRRASTIDGDRRDIAVGAERWLLAHRLGLRAGVAASTVGDARAALSGGASAAVVSGVWVEARATRGGDTAGRGWGVAAHVMF
jgi:F plasmid transfer operon, TraF, protein